MGVPNLSLYGLQTFSTANYLQTAVAGGEVGTASGFGVVAMFRLNNVTAATAYLLEKWTSSAGWALLSGGQFFMKTGVGSAQVNSTRPFVASDVGKIFLMVGRHSGASNLNQLYVDRVLNSSVAQSAFVPDSGDAMQGGAGAAGAGPADNVTLLATMAFRGTPTDAQLQALFDAARVLGDLPDTLQGATVTHLWSLKRELAGTFVTSGQTAPAQLTDRITAAAGDALARVSTGLDIRTDANSIRALGPFPTAADYLQTVQGGGIQGSNTFWVQVDLWLLAITASAQDPVGCAPSGLTTGWDLRLSGGGQMFGILGAGSQVLTSLYTLTSGDLNKRLRVVLNKTATVWQMFVNGVQVGSDVAATTYNANAANMVAMTVGQLSGVRSFNNGYVEMLQGGSAASLTSGEIAALNADLTTAAPIVAGKTQKRHVFEQDIAAASAFGVPSTSTERIGGGDSLYRFGGPLAVKVIDPTIDGRRTLGAQGFSAANYLQTSGGIRGNAAGFWGVVLVRFDLSSSTEDIVGTINTGATQGWSLSRSTTNLTLNVVNGAAISVAAPVGSVSALAGLLTPCVFVSTGTSLRLFVGTAVQTGADQAIVGYTASASAMFVGNRAGSSLGAAGSSVFGLAGGDGFVPTLAEVIQLFADFASTSRVPSIAGKTTHLWDLTTDILASGVDAVPATVLDRVGTDNLTKVGIAVQTDANAIRSVGPYGLADGWSTAPGGGVQGVNTGFFVVFDAWLTKIPTTSEIAACCCNATASTGWYLQFNAATLQWRVGAVATSSGYTVTSGDLNKRVRILIHKTATVIQLYVNGVQAGADVACASYNANASSPMTLGQFFGAQNFGSGYWESASGGPSSLTSGEIAALNADLTQPAPNVAGKTTKRWIFETDIAALSGALPSRSTEQISGGDDLVRIGSPLTLAQRTERLWSYETAPIWYGAQGAAGAYYSIAGGFAGDPASFGGVWIGTIDSQAVASQTRFLCGKRELGSGFPGFQLATIATNSAFQFTVGSSSAAVSPSTSAIASSELGKTFAVFFWFDGSKAHMAVRRIEIGTGSSALTGIYGASSQPFTLGARADASLPADGTTTRGFIALNGAPTLADVQAMHDAIMANESIPLSFPRTIEAYDLTKDVRANGGALPSTIVGRVAGQNLAQTGSPTLGSSYARAAA